MRTIYSASCKLVVVVFMLIISSSCGKSINFDPQFRMTSSEDKGLVLEGGQIILVTDEAYSGHYCMTAEKTFELYTLLNELKKDHPWMESAIRKNQSYQKLTKSFQGWNQTN